MYNSIVFRADKCRCRFTIVAQGIIMLYVTQNKHNYVFSLNNIFLRHEIHFLNSK